MIAEIAQKLGAYIEKQVPDRPEYARKLLLAAYRLYGWKLRHLPNTSLPRSKQYLGVVSMNSMIRPLAHPEKQVLASIFTPCEPIHAMGLYPMCAEQFATFSGGAWTEHALIEAAEHAGISETFCSYHKAVVGAAVSGVLPKPLAVVCTSLACDANQLTFRKVADLLSSPFFYIDVPYETDEDAVAYVAEQLHGMTAWLGEVTGTKLEKEPFREAMRCSSQTIRHLQEVIPLRRDHYVPSELTAEMYEVLMTHNALGTPEALHYAKMLRSELSEADNRPGRRILWMHSNPFYQETLKQTFNYSEDPRIVLTEMCSDNLIRAEEKDPYRAMAARLVRNSFNGPVTRRIDHAVRTARAVNADGVILFCHWGCKETSGGSAVIAKALEDEGYPVLVLNGDGVDRRNASEGQAATRIGAFLEMLEGRNKR